MKNKFIVLSITNLRWYSGYEDGLFLFDEDVVKAVRFATYQEAENIIGDLPTGIYQIDKIFIVE